MSSEDFREASGRVPSIISPDLKIMGDLKCTGDIQIDGTIEGLVKGGVIIIGERAKVEGSIVVETVRIFGTVNGRIRAKTVQLNAEIGPGGGLPTVAVDRARWLSKGEALTLDVGSWLNAAVEACI